MINSSTNLIYNNYFNNTINAEDDGNNIWSTTRTVGRNIIDGPYLGGNHWSDYIGTDTDKDGIGDTLVPYNTGITTGGDWLPLTPTNVLVETSTGTGTAQVSTDSGLFAEINAINEDSLPQEAKDNKPVGLMLPHGLFSFTITGLTPGQSVTLTITLPSPVPIGSLWWKVNTTAGNNTWYSLPIGDDNGDSVVTITLTDGGLGDNDGVANGVIVDPSGIGKAPPPILTTIESSDISGAKKDIFQPSESVYATGSGYPIIDSGPVTFNLNVVEDRTWTNGMAIPARVTGTATTVTTDGTGNIPVTEIWASSVVGKYDIVVDVNGNKKYDLGIDPLDDMDVNDAGFETIPEFSTIAIPVAAIFGLVLLFNRRRRG